MNWDIFAGNWKQFEGVLKVHWGKLHKDHFGVIDGKRIWEKRWARCRKAC